jgi:hypothetical protein
VAETGLPFTVRLTVVCIEPSLDRIAAAALRPKPGKSSRPHRRRSSGSRDGEPMLDATYPLTDPALAASAGRGVEACGEGGDRVAAPAPVFGDGPVIAEAADPHEGRCSI